MSGKKINKNLESESKKEPIKEESDEEYRRRSTEERKKKIVKLLDEYSDINIWIPDVCYYIIRYFDCSCSYYDNNSQSEITYPVYFQRRENNYIFSFHCLRSLPINHISVKYSNWSDGITLITYHDNDICKIKATWNKEI